MYFVKGKCTRENKATQFAYKNVYEDIFMINKAIIIFVMFGFLGWLWETVYCSTRDRKWANRGFLYGPICPIYGFGCVFGYFIYHAIQIGLLPNLAVWQIFLAGFVISMVLEYPTSWALEKLFNARWWDYSTVPLNINGRTSVPTSLAFSAAAILVMKFLIPWAVAFVNILPNWTANVLALLLIAVLSADTTLTVSALTNFQKYVAELDASFQNKMETTVEKMTASQDKFFGKAVKRIAVFKSKRSKIDEKESRIQRFKQLIKKYIESPKVKKMDKFIQHGDTTTLEHCENVAWISFLVNDRLHLNADEKTLVESAMLHDFYLYDWHDGDPARKTHGFDHPYIASENAEKEFHVSKKTQNAIKSHMWPLNITEIPKSKEAMIICFVDKYCALVEMLRLGKKPEIKEEEQAK